MTTNFDETVGRLFADAFKHQSRRSFLSRVTRGLFAAVGVALPAVVRPYRVEAQAPAAAANPDAWAWCGLHGPICTGNCHPSENGNKGQLGREGAPMTRWVACCKNPTLNKWRCVRYADYCGVRGRTYGLNCEGKMASGPTWCHGVQGNYICTDVNIAIEEYDNARSCTRGCHPDEIRCEPQE
jgi:hypothetical protein